MRVVAAAVGVGVSSVASAQVNMVPAPEPEAVVYRGDAGARRDVSETIERVRRQHGLPALGGALITLGGTEIIGVSGIRAVGSEEKVTLDDRFHVGSLTKAMTATLAARLVEQGRISWDTTLLDANRLLRDEIDGGWGDRTLRDFLYHRSGLPEDREPGVIFQQMSRAAGPLHLQRRAVSERIFADPPPVDAGERFAYSNFGYVAAGSMLEGMTAQTWEELIELELFKPLGIRSFGFGPPAPAPAEGEDFDLAHTPQPLGHTPIRTGGTDGGWQPVPPVTRGGLPADNPAWMGPAGTVHMTVQDLATFALAHLRGGAGVETVPALLPPSAFETLHTPPEDAGDEGEESLGGGQYAMGWLVGPSPFGIGNALAHDGSNGSFYAVVWLAPESGIGVVAVTNAGGNQAGAACHAVIGRLIADFVSEGEDDGSGEATGGATDPNHTDG